MHAIRWGIMGTGAIAATFARGLTDLPDAVLVAVGSRTAQAAEQFGARFGVPRHHASYAALAADPEVDAVYIATPHPFHYPNARLCLAAGKAVLCEKPFTLNAREAAALIEEARARGVFLMEAMWTRCLPLFVRLRELLAAGAIGTPRMVQADFNFRTAVQPRSRLFDLELGGGALLDVGVYPVSLASMVFGTPTAITSQAHIGTTGVDEQCGLVLHHADGALAVLTAAIRTGGPNAALIRGTNGSIQIPRPPSGSRLHLRATGMGTRRLKWRVVCATGCVKAR
jgi:predicted dehydrogenase